MKERIANFGPEGSLLGVVTIPQATAAKKPAFILINSGLLHRIGPFRLYVKLARTLANAGFTVLRMDLSGKGDSLPRRGGESYEDVVKSDIHDALEFLQTRFDIHNVVIAGICTGADNAYKYALHDSRVVGIVPIDGYAYRTPRFYARHYGKKIFVLRHWMNFARRIFSVSVKRIKSELANSRPVVNYRMMFPKRSRFRTDLQALLDRGVKTLIVYSGGWSVFYNYEGQFEDAFPQLAKHSNLQIEYNPNADHTYILSADRERLIDHVCKWAIRNF